MVSEKTKCILKQVAIAILIAFITFVIMFYIISSAIEGMYNSIDPVLINETNWNVTFTQTTNTYQPCCFSPAPVLYAIIGIIGIIMWYYWFVKPCLVKEKTDKEDKK